MKENIEDMRRRMEDTKLKKDERTEETSKKERR